MQSIPPCLANNRRTKIEKNEAFRSLWVFKESWELGGRVQKNIREARYATVGSLQYSVHRSVVFPGKCLENIMGVVVIFGSNYS